MSEQVGARAFLAGISVVALTLSAGAALAQQATASATAAATRGGAGAEAAASSTAVSEVVVTAQHKEENIQNVPIAVTALSGAALEARSISGGPDLLKAVPNMSFTKTNFSGYDLTIRGIGSEAVSVASDPGVSVNYNEVPLIRNRLFEQDFYDIQDVEVLRGPQGTLYGRNATGGAVNIISSKPTDTFGAMLKAEAGTYDTRKLSGYVNIPIAGDMLDLRVAGSYLGRGGYEYDSTTGDNIDGRDLYSTRVTLAFKPSDNLHGYLLWEHFNESDDRERSGKQLCTTDPGPSSIGGIPLNAVGSAEFSQGCLDAPLNTPAAFGTPNGLSLPMVSIADGNFAGVLGASPGILGISPTTGANVYLLKATNPYAETQSTNLREIASAFTPKYKARNDNFEFHLEYDLTANLKLTSITSYDRDTYYSTEDYNRFATVPDMFNSSVGLLNWNSSTNGPGPNITPNGVYCDPQLGCSNTIEGLDISQAVSKQFNQEFRLSSSFSGPFNFSAGVNYTYYKTDEDYYVLFNTLTATSQSGGSLGQNSATLNQCQPLGNSPVPVTSNSVGTGCSYIDPNSLKNINGQGHNYFRSDNPYELNSYSAFAEAYYQIEPSVKLTVGARYTDDNKDFLEVPSQILLSGPTATGGNAGGGTVDGGYPSNGLIHQHWGAVTGRAVLDWTPTISFTDQTLVYFSYNRGYKAGGANPPGVGFDTQSVGGQPPSVSVLSYPLTFKPEYVDAFEIGTKNTLLQGALTLNADAFFYNYANYQVSQIEDDTAINQNFNARVWGAELESKWRATRQLTFDVNLGYEGSSIRGGDNADDTIDVANRTQGNPNYTIVKPYPLIPNNCVMSTSYAAQLLTLANEFGAGPGTVGLACPGFSLGQELEQLGLFPTPTAADLPNQGQGFYAHVKGHSLPNQPHLTQSIGAQYTQPLPEGWDAIFRVDVYHQSSSWARVYQDPIDKLEGWSNINLRLTLAKPAQRLLVEAYVTNLLNNTPITGTFLNSDNTGLTSNVFTLDPRVIGVSITKKF